jgi:hypothetical protein
MADYVSQITTETPAKSGFFAVPPAGIEQYGDLPSRVPAGTLASRVAAKQSPPALSRRRARCAFSNLSERRSPAALTQTGPRAPTRYLP